jgi:type IV pilus assembly protein PilZ
MSSKSEEIFRRKKQQCPECGGIISDTYIEQNPFPEIPCPSCNFLISAISMKDLEFPSKDERSEERLNAKLMVSYDNYNEFITQYTRDVSKGGTFINTKRHHSINEIVELSLDVPGLDKPLKIKGEVVHIKIQNVPDEDAGIGVKFLDIDEESRKALVDFIKFQKDF